MQNNMNLSLKNRKWKDFNFSKVFNINTGANVPKKFLKKGNYPRITATEQDNGVADFTTISAHKNFRTLNNFISVSFLGGVFYHSYTASLDMKIHAVQIKNVKLNKYLAEFITYTLKRLAGNTSYGNQVSSTDLLNKKIFLSITHKGNPDYSFMETFMRKIEHKKLKAYKKYISKRINELENTENIVSLKEKEWSEFEIGKLFTLFLGKSKGLNHLTKTNKGISYLGATNLNNGVICQVEKDTNLIQKGNAIAFIRNGEGAMGYSIYKFESFIATSDISVGYNDKLNQYNGLFITTIADKVRGKYNFGYKRSGRRLDKEKLVLPINDQGNPDYEYMENYMKKMEYNQIQKYLKFKDKL